MAACRSASERKTPGARAAHGPDAAADAKRFDEQLVLVEGARRIAGREHDDHHLPVPRTNRAEERWWLRRTDARCPRQAPREGSQPILGQPLAKIDMN